MGIFKKLNEKIEIEKIKSPILMNENEIIFSDLITNTIEDLNALDDVKRKINFDFPNDPNEDLQHDSEVARKELEIPNVDLSNIDLTSQVINGDN